MKSQEEHLIRISVVRKVMTIRLSDGFYLFELEFGEMSGPFRSKQEAITAAAKHLKGLYAKAVPGYTDIEDHLYLTPIYEYEEDDFV